MLSIYDIVIAAFVCLFAAAGYRLASQKGRNRWVWMVVCFLFPFFLPVLVLLKDKKSGAEAPHEDQL